MSVEWLRQLVKLTARSPGDLRRRVALVMMLLLLLLLAMCGEL